MKRSFVLIHFVFRFYNYCDRYYKNVKKNDDLDAGIYIYIYYLSNYLSKAYAGKVGKEGKATHIQNGN